MARIIKKQETEIGLEGVIRIVKKNWDLLAHFIYYRILEGKGIVRVEACFVLVGISDALRQAEGLIVQVNELEEAITRIFREIACQKPHFKNMEIAHLVSPHRLNVSFDIDIAVAPVMPVDPLDIPGPDNPMDPDPVKRAEINSRRLALLTLGAKVTLGGKNVLDDTDPEPIPEGGHL